MIAKNTQNKFIKRLKDDYAFRTLLFGFFSFAATVVFTGYNVFLAVAYRTAFSIGIAVYYASLVSVRAYVFCSEYAYLKAGLDETQKECRRKHLFFVQSILLFVTDVALIAPAAMMVKQQKAVNYSEIPAIATAAYTTYKIILSARNLIKARAQNNLSVRVLRNVNFTDALVSILSLQYILVMTFGDGTGGDMHVLLAISTFAIWAFVCVLSVLTLITAVRIKGTP